MQSKYIITQHIITQQENGWTLRKWARYHLPKIEYPTLCQLVRKKLIRVNGKNTKLSMQMSAQDIVELKNIVVNISEKIVNLSSIKEMIVHETSDFAIIEKPYGIACQGEEGSIAYLTNAFIVQRLDKTTTGIMVIAKTKQMADILSQQIREHKLKKVYNAILSSTQNLEDSGTWNDAIDEKPATTHYRVLDRTKNLVEFTTTTGRKHQIRIHSAMHGSNILGDNKYSSKTYNKEKRIYLHCTKIAFEHNGTTYEFTSAQKLI